MPTFLFDRWDEFHDATAGLFENRNWLRSGMRNIVVSIRIDRSGSRQVLAQFQSFLQIARCVVVLHCLLVTKNKH